MFIDVRTNLYMIHALTLDAQRLIDEGKYANAMFALNKIAEYNIGLRENIKSKLEPAMLYVITMPDSHIPKVSQILKDHGKKISSSGGRRSPVHLVWAGSEEGVKLLMQEGIEVTKEIANSSGEPIGKHVELKLRDGEVVEYG